MMNPEAVKAWRILGSVGAVVLGLLLAVSFPGLAGANRVTLVLAVIAAAVLAPIILRHRAREAAKAKAMRASQFTRPPVPGTRRG